VANTRSARKQIRAAERKHVRNRAVRSEVRTRINTVRKTLLSGGEVSVEEELKSAIKALDKASEKGILHRNNVRRRKSRIASMAARLMQVSGSDADAAAARSAAAGGVKGKSTKAAAGKGKTAAKAKAAPKSKSTAPKATAAKAATKAATKPKAPAKS
jgi:small subunit ribosomal protein S20